MHSIDHIREQLTEHKADLEQFNVERLSVFGSAGREDPEARDLDFLVKFSKPPGLLDFMGLKFFLEDLFAMSVDLHSQASCPQRFFRRIEADLKHVA